MKNLISCHSFILILAICFFAGQKAYAQEAARSFISVSGGISSPAGNFISNQYFSNVNADNPALNIINTTSGFAKTGTHFALEGAWYFHPNIGIGGVFSTSSYNLDVEKLAAGYRTSFDCDSAAVSARPYHSINFLVGPYFALPLHKFTIEARILAGLTNFTSPDISGTVINFSQGPNQGSSSTFVQKSSTANTLGFQAGLGVRYAIINHLMISLRGDYFYSKPNLSLENVSRTNNAGRLLGSYNQAVAGINASFGIGYEF